MYSISNSHTELNKTQIRSDFKDDSGDERKKDKNDYLYISVNEIKWATPIAVATAMAESTWKRECEKASTLFKMWRNQHPRETELDLLFYSGRHGIRSRLAKHLWRIICRNFASIKSIIAKKILILNLIHLDCIKYFKF